MEFGSPAAFSNEASLTSLEAVASKMGITVEE
jgi:hypothetical protein